MRILWTHILVYMICCLKKEPIDAILCLRHGAGRFDIGRSARLEPGGFYLVLPGGGTAQEGKIRSDYYYYLPLLQLLPLSHSSPHHLSYAGYRDGAGGCGRPPHLRGRS